MRSGNRVALVPPARRVIAVAVSVPGHDRGLVMRRPVPDAISEPRDDGFDVSDERLRGAPDEARRESGAEVAAHDRPLVIGDGAVTWQRAACPRRASTSSGVTCEQTSIASGQRLTKRQPSGGSTAAEARPLRISIG